MATETVTPANLSITHQRRMVGLEATWELSALNEAISDLCRDMGSTGQEQHKLMSLNLKIRGLTMRMSQLIDVAMAVIGGDGDANDLFMTVHGHEPAAEVAHV